MDLTTRIVHAGQDVDTAYNSVIPPIYQTSTFCFDDVGKPGAFEYSRVGNPTREALEALLAELEDGSGAVATASGMAAIALVLSLFDGAPHVICCHDCYGGTARLLGWWHKQKKIDLSFVDFADPQALEAAVRSESKILWVETPSNPLLRVIDLEAMVQFARRHGLTVIVDNTFLSPLLQRPIQFGADLVVHSTTKYLNGHSDVVGGAVIARTVEQANRVRFAAKCLGGIAGPFDCWLTLRGIKTLPLRMPRHCDNAMAVARFLQDHAAVEQVFYPGLPSHPQHRLAVRQQKGFGGMVSVALKGGIDAVHHLLRATNIFTLAESLGGIESLIGHPATMSHAGMTAAQRAAAGITDNIVRLSVGIEQVDDLIADLNQALDSLPA